MRTRCDIHRLGQYVCRLADRFTKDIQHLLTELLTEIQATTHTAVEAERNVSAKIKSEILEVIESGLNLLDEEKQRWEKVLHEKYR